jgi:hypothetical protein
MSASAEVLNEDNGDNPNPEASVGGQGRDDESCCACVSEQVYVDSGNKKKILFLMCIGLMFRNNDNEEQPLLSFQRTRTCTLRIRNTSLRLHGVPICLTLFQYLVEVTGQGFKYLSGSTTIRFEMLWTSNF